MRQPSEVIRQRVNAARDRQQSRFDGLGLTCNADTRSAAHIREYCELDETSKALMRSAMNQLGMSARAFHRVLKLSRTIADLAGAEQIQAAHPSASLTPCPSLCGGGAPGGAGLAEAIHLRSTKTAGMRDKSCVT